MKIRNLFIAAMTLVLAAASCQKIDRTETQEKVNIEFTVADKPSFEGDKTKAIKSNWADGDKILIFLRSRGNEWLINDPLTLTYSSSTGWSSSDISPETHQILGPYVKYVAIHHRGDITYSNEKITSGSITGYQLEGYNGGELMMYSGLGTKGGSNVILGEITMALDSRLVQFSVSKTIFDPSEAINKYSMNIYKDNTSNLAMVALKRGFVFFNPEDENVFLVDCTEATDKAQQVENGNDLSFCFFHPTGISIIPSIWKFELYRKVNVIGSSAQVTSITINISTEGKSIVAGKAYRLPETGYNRTEN